MIMQTILLVLSVGIALAQQSLYDQHMNEGDLLEQSGRYQEARAVYEFAVKDAVGSSDFEFREATARNDLGFVDRYLGHVAEARRQYQQALALFEKARGATSPESASVLQNLSVLDYQEGHLDE